MQEKKSDAQREEVIQYLVGILRHNPFSFEFAVKKNPKGIKIIYEVTQEDMDKMIPISM